MLAAVLVAAAGGLAVPRGVSLFSTTARAADGAPAPGAVLTVAKKKGKGRKLKVRKIRPRNGKTFVALDASIVVRFSQPVDPASIDEHTVKFRRLLGDDVPWTAELRKGNKQLVIQPGTFLDPGRDYELEVRFGITSDRGVPLRREARSIFFTDATVPPFQFLRPEQFADVETTMFEGRAAHSASVLSSGAVLLAGGQSDYTRVSDTADVFDPADDAFRPVLSKLFTARAYHLGLEVNGGALLAGGWDGNDATATTEIFDPSSGRFARGPTMLEKRDFLAGVVLQDGRVLIVGGLSYSGTSASYSLTAEIFDPATGGWRLTRRAPLERRAGHAMTVLDDGRVLITGGLPPGGASGPVAELFDPESETFTLTGSPSLGYRQLHTSTLLSDGRVLIADGGNGKTELYDPASDRFCDAGGSSFARRTRSTATLLPGDRVLLLGGFASVTGQTLILDSMDIYLATAGGGTGRVVHVDYVLAEPRAGHTATVLGDGRTLIVGGFGSASEDSLTTGLLLSPD